MNVDFSDCRLIEPKAKNLELLGYPVVLLRERYRHLEPDRYHAFHDEEDRIQN